MGIIRKLRLNETLRKHPASGTWIVDLTNAQRSHKSAKFHGGTRTALPQPVWALIDRLCQLTVFDLEHADKYYLFHNTRTRDAMRPLTESQFGAWVAGLFEKYGGTRVVPKNLRSVCLPAPPVFLSLA